MTIQTNSGLLSSTSLGLLGNQILANLDRRWAPEAVGLFDDFALFCERHLVIQNKRGDLVPLKLNRAQRELIAALTGHDLVLKARQVGMSTALQAWLFFQQMKGHARTSTLCHEDDLTSTLRLMADRFYDQLDGGLQPARKYANARLTTYPERHSEGSIATVGGQAGSRKGRGGSVTHIHGSEVAFWPNAEAVLSGAMQAGNPDIYLESTPNGMVGWFYERCMEALDDPNSLWTLHFFPWWYDDEYRLPLADGERLAYTDDEQALVDAHGLDAEQIQWRRHKQRELPHTFEQEYPEDPRKCFLASGISYFRDIEHVFTAPMEAQPQPGHRYWGGLDFGQTDDFTVLVIIDGTTNEQVDFLRVNRLEWQAMRRQISVTANRWDATVMGEANSMGSTNTELLQRGEILEDGSRIAPIKLVPFDTTASSKPPLIQGLYHALHEAGLRLQNHSVIRHELRAFVSKQLPSGAWAYEASGGAHDDTVMATALAWHGSRRGHVQVSETNPFFN